MQENVAEELSPEALAELDAEHIAGNRPDADGSVIILAFAEPASTSTELGLAAVATAVKFLQMPLREDAGVNQDSHGYIRTFFLEGLKWPADTWDHWIEKHPQQKVIKPEWCAAFGSYCVRKAYEAAGKSLPARLCGSASDLQAKFQAADRFLLREKLFFDNGPIRDDAPAVPGPGDLVVFHGHVGMLRELYADGSFITIEGNTYKSSPRKDGVYQLNRNSAQKRDDGTFKLVGFCLLASVDGQPPASQESPTPAQQSPAPTQQSPAQTQQSPAQTQQSPAQTQQSPAQTQQSPAQTQPSPAPTQPSPASPQQSPDPTQPSPAPTQQSPAQTSPESPAVKLQVPTEPEDGEVSEPPPSES